jgi:uncharacterized membrane protein YgcG
MKKVIGIAILLLAFIASPGAGGHALAATDVNNFTISNYRINQTLSRDSEGRSNLKTVETIDALFPSYDQNHGIERAIPTTYDNHGTSLAIISVADESGRPRKYTTYDSNSNLVLRIGDADTYVHGLQHYTITYTQRDVTRYFADTGNDEFYWDTNGTGWSVPISALSVNLHIQDALKGQQTGRQQCYLGTAGSTGTCDLTPTGDGFALHTNDLSPGENATLAVGFKRHTFSAYKQSPGERFAVIWGISLLITAIIAFALITWFVVRYHRKSNRAAEHKSIVPEYVPPEDISVAAAAAIYRNARSVFGAQLIDFAVRGYVTIYQIRAKTFFRKAGYELEIVKEIAELKDEEQELFRDLFSSVEVGARLNFDELKNRTSVAAKLSDNPGKLTRNIKGVYGLRAKDPRQSAWFKRAGVYTLIAAVLTLSPWLLMAAIVAFVCAYMLWPLTDKGLALYHYLEGLKMYIKTAETERIRMLQGPETAEKVGSPIDTNDARQMVKLYEKVLPYAMIFGLEKAWNDKLGQYYESLGGSPGWLVSNNTAFNAAVFSSTLNSFSTAATYSNPSSASTGGSGGGGSSGGGGGGGGGGGW